MIIPVVSLIILVSFMLGNDMAAKPLTMWIAAFLCPVVGFFWAIMAKNKEQNAAETGNYGDMKRGQFCAELVRKEAISASIAAVSYR